MKGWNDVYMPLSHLQDRVLVFHFDDIVSGRYQTFCRYIVRCYLLNKQGDLKVIGNTPGDTFPASNKWTIGAPAQSPRLYYVPYELIRVVREIVATGLINTHSGKKTLTGYAEGDFLLLGQLLDLKINKLAKERSKFDRITNDEGHAQKLPNTQTRYTLNLTSDARMRAMQRITYENFNIVYTAAMIKQAGDPDTLAIMPHDNLRVIHPDKPVDAFMPAFMSRPAARKRRKGGIFLTYEKYHRATHGTLTVSVTWNDVVYSDAAASQCIWL
jgi:hypothetical protein